METTLGPEGKPQVCYSNLAFAPATEVPTVNSPPPQPSPAAPSLVTNTPRVLRSSTQELPTITCETATATPSTTNGIPDAEEFPSRNLKSTNDDETTMTTQASTQDLGSLNGVRLGKWP